MEESPIRVLLLDVEGTTTSVDFVYKTLFPYARKKMKSFIERNYGTAALSEEIDLLAREHAAEKESNRPRWRDGSRRDEIDSIVDYALWLMDRDRKSTALKAIQGKIWKEGFEAGEIRSHVYPDVLRAFERWRQSGREVCIFSSGSVLAQKLLFAHTAEGDLTPLIRSYFDTTTGPKRESASYRRIAEWMHQPAASILFISDTPAELDAARSAGMGA